MSEVSIPFELSEAATRFFALIRLSDPSSYNHLRNKVPARVLDALRSCADLHRLRDRFEETGDSSYKVPQFVVDELSSRVEEHVGEYLNLVANLGKTTIPDTVMIPLIRDAAEKMWCSQALLASATIYSFPAVDVSALFTKFFMNNFGSITKEQWKRIPVSLIGVSRVSGYVPCHGAVRNIRTRGNASRFVTDFDVHIRYWTPQEVSPPSGSPEGGEEIRDFGQKIPSVLEGSGVVVDTPMYEIFLPVTLPVPPNHNARNPHYSITGKRLKVGKMISARLHNKPVPRPFRRNLNHPGGTILLDASGSMSFTNEQLREFLSSAPAANISYYSTHHREALQSLLKGDPRIRIKNFSSDGEVRGYLCHFARDGKMYDQEEVPVFGGGNGVDLQALQWLLTMPAPRYFVTDRGFCGMPEEERRQCGALFKAARNSGVIKAPHNIESLLDEMR